MATRLTPFWPRPATTSGSLWPGSGLCALCSGPLSGSSHTAAAPLPHQLKRLNSLFHRRLDRDAGRPEGVAADLGLNLSIPGSAPNHLKGILSRQRRRLARTPPEPVGCSPRPIGSFLMVSCAGGSVWIAKGAFLNQPRDGVVKAYPN